jgi:cation diffusion facilitator CzcD-associated flavoprotein CzcO
MGHQPRRLSSEDGLDCDVVVIGAGFAGLYAVQKFTALGFKVIAFEKGDDVGGVWYWNRYPGARCDCESYYYSYSFSHELQQDWRWSLRYSEQPEILQYLSHVADRFDLRRHFRFSTSVTKMEFDDRGKVWTVQGSDGASVTTRFVVSAMGCLSEIQRPNIPGLDDFSGELLFTAAWPRSGVDLSGKRVGIIGTGASGVQVISRIAPVVKHLTVFQRTANWVIPVWNGPMSAEFDHWVKEHYGEIRERCLSSQGGVPFPPAEVAALELSEELRRATLDKYWERGGTQFFSAFTDAFTKIEANDIVADFVKDYIRSIVKDPKVAETLIPNDHPVGTKRPPMDDDYYATFNRDNVTLVNLRESPVTGFRGHALLTAKDTCDLDVLILATGFDAITGALLAIDVKGSNGRRLRDAWADGPRSFLGLGVSGFPNLFTITGPLSPSVLANMPTAVEQHVDWIADCLTYMKERDLRSIEATENAQKEWVEHVEVVANHSLYPRANSWYFGSNIPGKPRQFGVYIGGFSTYRQKCQSLAQNAYDGFALY